MVCTGLAERIKRDARKNALDNTNRNIFSNMLPPLLYPNHPANLAAVQARHRHPDDPVHRYEPACHQRARMQGREEGYAFAMDRMDRRYRAGRELDEKDYADYAHPGAHPSGGRPATQDGFERYIHPRERRADYHRMVQEAREREHEFQRRNLSPIREEPPVHRYHPEDYAPQEPMMQHGRPAFEGFEEREPRLRGAFDGFGVEERVLRRHRQSEGREEGMGRYRDEYAGYGQAPAYDRFEGGGYGEGLARDPFERDHFQRSPARYGESTRDREAYDAGLDGGFRHREAPRRRSPPPYSPRW